MERTILYYENRIHKLQQNPVENRRLIAKCERKLRNLRES